MLFHWSTRNRSSSGRSTAWSCVSPAKRRTASQDDHSEKLANSSAPSVVNSRRARYRPRLPSTPVMCGNAVALLYCSYSPASAGLIRPRQIRRISGVISAHLTMSRTPAARKPPGIDRTGRPYGLVAQLLDDAANRQKRQVLPCVHRWIPPYRHHLKAYTGVDRKCNRSTGYDGVERMDHDRTGI